MTDTLFPNMQSQKMTSEERHRIRALIDQARRNQPSNEPQCKGCGADLDAQTIGCRQCATRAYKRAKRADDVFKMAERKRERLRRKYGPWHRGQHTCRGCGTPWDNPNPACPTCDSRMIRRTGTRKWRQVAR